MRNGSYGTRSVGLFLLFLMVILLLAGCGPVRDLNIRRGTETIEAEAYRDSLIHIEHYQFETQAAIRAVIRKTDALLKEAPERSEEILPAANRECARILREKADRTLTLVLQEAVENMRNRYLRSDA